MEKPENRMMAAPENRAAASKAPKKERSQGLPCKWCGMIGSHEVRNEWPIEAGRVRRKRFCSHCKREFTIDEASTDT